MKIKEFQNLLWEKGADFALFYSVGMNVNPNLFYFTQYTGIGCLIIPKKHGPFLIVPKMEYQRAKKSLVKQVYLMDKKKFFESVDVVINKNKLKRNAISIDCDNFSLNVFKHYKKQFKKSKTKDISSECLKLRQIKNNKEIVILKKSCGYANKILEKAVNNFKNFKTESQVAAFLEYETKKLGLGVSFPPIVASGSNGSMPHYEPKNVKLKKGFCVMDFGVKYKGYCSDMTRTIYLGKINRKEKGIYALLLNTQKSLIMDIKKNDNCGKIYESSVKKLKNYSKYFIHGLGHGVGVEIHELPNLTLNSKDKIEENVVFTIEPGIYLPNKFGIRIEDTILMGKKPIILTKMSKELLVI